MTKEEKDLMKEVTELKGMVYMLFNKVNVLAELSPEFEEIDKAFKVIDEKFSGFPRINPDYKSDRQT